jgi:hypothetical protein
MIKQLSVAVLATVALGMAPLASAQAATHQAPKPLPNPCKTFTIKSARTLLGVGKHTRLTEKLSRTSHPVTRNCTIHHGKTTLTVTVSRQSGGGGMNQNCFARPRLGSQGQVCVSIPHTPPFSFAQFKKHGLWITDGINLRLPNKGNRIYQFALPQHKNFKG